MTAPHRIALTGGLTMATAGQAYRDAARLPARADIIVDLAAVDTVDSSAVAVLLSLIRLAASRSSTVRLVAAPERLMAIADIYNARDILAAHV